MAARHLEIVKDKPKLGYSSSDLSQNFHVCF